MKELAKFGCGVTTWGFIVHVALELSDNLPITMLGVTLLTPTTNTLLMLVTAILSLVFASCAWGKTVPNRNVG